MKRILLVVLLLLFALAGTLAVVRSRAARPASTPAVVSFTAIPQVIRRGESVTLNWETEGVPSVALEWGPELRPLDNKQKEEGLPSSGTMTFQPEEDTIYVLECEPEQAQMCTASASVRVR